MNNKRPGNIAILGTLALILCGAAVLWAVDYATVFDYSADGSNSVTLGSPHGGAVYAVVTSKFNQPRKTESSASSNPHRGTDLRSAYGTRVYAPWNGWVVVASGTDFEMRLDINNDGVRNDNAYYRYDHLSSIQVANGAFVTKGTWVASSGDENETTPAHLHFGVKKDTGTDAISDAWVRNEPYYRTITAWDNGRLLDFMSNSTWDSTNHVAATYCYAADEVSQNEAVAQGDVVFYHRLTAGAWSATVGTKSGNRFSIDLTGVYSSGSQIQWMVRCSRTSKIGVANPYWAFEPPKFAQPDFNPNATAQLYRYFASTMN